MLQAMLVHPDKNMGSSLASESFKKLQCAYEVITVLKFDLSGNCYYQSIVASYLFEMQTDRYGFLILSFVFRFFLMLSRSETMMSNSERKSLRV